MRERSVGQIAVVPLFEMKQHYIEEDGVAFIEAPAFDNPAQTETVLALCQEIYTIDWKKRNPSNSLGDITDKDMEKVQNALRNYLKLPK